MVKKPIILREDGEIFISPNEEASITIFFTVAIISAIVAVIAVGCSTRGFFAGAWPAFSWLLIVGTVICAISFWLKKARQVISPVAIGLFFGFWLCYAAAYSARHFLFGLFP